jgi:hypothetical protein
MAAPDPAHYCLLVLSHVLRSNCTDGVQKAQMTESM